MPKRADLAYPRLTIRRYGPWGAWNTAVVVRVLDRPGARERSLSIHQDHTRAHSAARAIINRIRLGMELDLM